MRSPCDPRPATCDLRPATSSSKLVVEVDLAVELVVVAVDEVDLYVRYVGEVDLVLVAMDEVGTTDPTARSILSLWKDLATRSTSCTSTTTRSTSCMATTTRLISSTAKTTRSTSSAVPTTRLVDLVDRTDGRSTSWPRRRGRPSVVASVDAIDLDHGHDEEVDLLLVAVRGSIASTDM